VQFHPRHHRVDVDQALAYKIHLAEYLIPYSDSLSVHLFHKQNTDTVEFLEAFITYRIDFL
jgi:hypothetical protein